MQILSMLDSMLGDIYMILSEKLNLLFIKVPKTGSSSFELALAPHLEQSALITPILDEVVHHQWMALFPNFAPQWENRAVRLAHSTLLAIKQKGMSEFYRRLVIDLKKKEGPKELGPDFWRFYNHISAKDIKTRIGTDKFSKLQKVAIVRHPYTRIISAYRYRVQKVPAYRSNPPSFENWFQREKALFRPITYFTHIKRRSSLNQVLKYETLDFDISEMLSVIGLNSMGFKKRFNETKIHYFSPPTTKDMVGSFFKGSRVIKEVDDEYAADFIAFNYHKDI